MDFGGGRGGGWRRGQDDDLKRLRDEEKSKGKRPATSDRPFFWRASLHDIFHEHYRNIVGMVLFYLVAIVPFWANPILMARLIDSAAQPPDIRLHLFFLYSGLMVAVVLINFPMALVFYRYASRITRGVGRNLRTRMCRQLQQLSILYHDKHSAGPLQSKTIRDIEIIERFPRMVLENIVQVLIVLAVALVTVAVRAPSTIFFFLTLLVVAVALNRLFIKKFRFRIHEYRSSLEKMTTKLVDMLIMVPVTRAHGLEKYELDNTIEKINTVAQRGRILDITGGSFGAGGYVSVTLVYTVFVALSIWMCFQGKLTVGDVVMFSSFFSRLSGGITGLMNTLPEISQVKESIQSIQEILTATDYEFNEGKAAVAAVEGRIEFRNVTYQYPGRNEPAVYDQSFMVESGESVALVGPSGCGKTTTLSLAMGFIRPTRGNIVLDGRDMNELDMRTFRQHVGVVTQDTVFFSGSVRENVAYGAPDTPPAVVMEALERAQAMDFIRELPEGVETRIGESGIKLSGGQRQRLSIARALVRRPRILIFDEATSSLDVKTEHIFQETLLELIRDRTTFIVSHRLSTVRNAHRIIVIENGRITHVGSHAALAAYPNYYSDSIKLHTME
jgi:ATP-binding cassette subfamily B protein